MDPCQRYDPTATTREAIRLVDQYESDEAMARRLHEELNGTDEREPVPARRQQSFCVNQAPTPRMNERDLSNVTEIRRICQQADEELTNRQELPRHFLPQSESQSITNAPQYSDLPVRESMIFDNDRGNEQATPSNNDSFIEIQPTDSSEDDQDSSSSDESVDVDERLHELFAGLLQMIIQGRPQGLRPAQIEALPTQRLREAFTEYSCPVCMDDLARDDEVRRLPCLHILHKDCIDPWLKEKHECPTCKFDISSIFDDNDSD